MPSATDQSSDAPARRRPARYLGLVLMFAALAAFAGPVLGQVEGPTEGGTRPVNPQVVEQTGTTWEGATKVGLVIAVIVIPMILGGWLARRLRMPDYGWKFAVAIGSLAAAALVVTTGELKLGPDLSGGITLIYELERDEPTARAVAKGDEKQAADEETEAEDLDGDDALGSLTTDEKVELLVKALTERVDPSGVKEVTIRKYGEGQIEIIIPRAEKEELEYIERRIYTAGALEFRITASPRFSKHKPIIDIAERLPPGRNIVELEGKEVARWVPFDDREFGDVEQARGRGLVTRMSGSTPQALVMTDDGLDVTGEYLRSAQPDVDETGRPQVSFTFNRQGALRFGQLTGNHVPTASGERYNLGILLDKRLLSAPTIESKITDRGRISGGSMSNEEVNFVVGILNAGSLPAALNKTPIHRAQISPTLGKQTILYGQRALIGSLIFVAIFMIFYYRFAGIVAVFGLAANMLLIVGAMVLIKGAFTLPGLAGLVLTVGMSVDANVLIYERLREELKRGAAMRMAIRNGFDRATQTIIDSNVTNLITGIVIYKIAPDNVKGFGLTLVLGIAMSIFTAVFLTRIVFDVAEKRFGLKSLRMRQFIGETHWDFLKWRRVSLVASGIVIAIGLTAAAMRGQDLLDIDFTGGSSVTMVLDDDKPMEFDEVLAELQKTNLADKNLALVETGNTRTRYTITSTNDNVDDVEQQLIKAFGDRLKAYEVEVADLSAIEGGTEVGARRPRGWLNAPRLLSPLAVSAAALLQQPGEAPATEEAEPADEPAVTDDADGAEEAAETPSDEQPAGVNESTPAPEPQQPPAAGSDNGATPASEGQSAGAEQTVPADSSAAVSEEDLQFAGGASARLLFRVEGEGGASEGVSYATVEQLLTDALNAAGHKSAAYSISNPDYDPGSARNFNEWDVKLALGEAEAQTVLADVESKLDGRPIFPLSNKIGSRVATRMASDAIAAIVLCLLGIIGYVWFRFHGVVYGLAAVSALIHDVLVTFGFVALSGYLISLGPVAEMLGIEKFQIGLTMVAAFLTIIGYSLNDTIVIFDRLREVKGKSPRINADMVNLAINQTFARTLLTAFTSLISVVVLYVAGGEGIHPFAYALLIGFIAGCYSTIYIANPVLLWLSKRAEASTVTPGSKAA